MSMKEDYAEIVEQIQEMSNLKDELVKAGDYEKAALTRDRLWNLQSKKQRIEDWFNHLNSVAPPKSPTAAISTPSPAAVKASAPPKWRNGFIDSLQRIVELTDYDSPGVYEPNTLEAVNYIARKALELHTIPSHKWSHHQKNSIGPRTFSQPPAIESAIEKLSGDLSYDKVGEAKQILKDIVG